MIGEQQYRAMPFNKTDIRSLSGLWNKTMWDKPEVEETVIFLRKHYWWDQYIMMEEKMMEKK